MFNKAKEGDVLETTCFVKDIEQKNTKTGKPFIVLTLSDKDKEEIKAKTWDCTKKNFNEQVGGKLAYCSIKVGSYNGSLDFVVQNYREALEDEGNIADFIKSAPLSGTEMFNNILGFVSKFQDEDYKKLILTIYQDNKDKILYWSAAKSVHHNMLGGLLWHTYRMLNSAVNLCKIYTVNSKELLFTGIILHDIGKIVELETNKEGVAEYTIPGSLLGHSMIGCDMVLEAGKRLKNVPDEKILCLRHMIASHHGKLEWGAIELPQLPEAYLLHELDMIDSRMYQYEEVSKQTDLGSFSEKVFGLNNKPVYRPLI